jgi:hypothetical protein
MARGTRPRLGDLRWNAKRRFYQIYMMVHTGLLFPLPMWVKAKNQKKVKRAFKEGYTNMIVYNRDLRQGKAGPKAPHRRRRPRHQIPKLEATIPLVDIIKVKQAIEAAQEKAPAPLSLNIPGADASQELPELAEALERPKYSPEIPQIQPSTVQPSLAIPPTSETDMETARHPACPCPGSEHSYERPCNIETGLRPVYRTVLDLAAGTSGTLELEVNDPGSIDRLWLGASDIATGTLLDAAVTIEGQMQLNSINWDFAKGPSSTLRPFNELQQEGLGMKMGRLDLIKTDTVEIPLTNNSAVAVRVECVLSLWGPCHKHHLKKPTRAN